MFPLKLGSELQNLVKEIPIHYEDINKIQTEFPRSGIFPRSGMYRRCHASCVRTHLHYLCSCFGQHICLMVSFIICGNLTFIQIRCVRQKRLFFFNEIIICRHEISFCVTFNYFCEPKIAKTLLIFLK